MKGDIKMRNIKFMLLALFMVASASIVRAENSATAYDAKYYSQQVFVVAYNNNASTLANNTVVILDATQAINPNNYLGSYVTLSGATTDSIYVFGVTDESILSGSLGRIAVRGPHKVLMPSPPTGAGVVIGACSNVSSNNGKACATTTADGTASGQLGFLLSATASTDNNDAANTYWAWIRPQQHK